MPNQNMTKEEEKLAERLHNWYLEACQNENLKETQKFLDRYYEILVIAKNQLENIPRTSQEEVGRARGENLMGGWTSRIQEK